MLWVPAIVLVFCNNAVLVLTKAVVPCWVDPLVDWMPTLVRSVEVIIGAAVLLAATVDVTKLGVDDGGAGWVVVTAIDDVSSEVVLVEDEMDDVVVVVELVAVEVDGVVLADSM